jgi:hypothetical protein
LGIRDAGGGWLETVFPMDGGLCARGLCVGELAARVRRGTAHDGPTGRNLILDEGIAEAGSRLRGASGVDIIVDGNHRGEVLSLAAGLAAAHPARIRSFVALPAEDLLVLAHAWASGATTAGIEVLDDVDGLLVVGDPFSSNPRSAKPILAFKRRNRRAPLAVIDSTPRRTAVFATHPVIVEPGRVPAAVACAVPAAAAAVIRQSPREVDPTGALERALVALGKCGRVGVIIASQPGRGCSWPSAAYYAGLLARSQGTKLGVLTQYGNARGAARFIASGMLQPVGHLTSIAPEGRAAVVIGERDSCLPTGDIADWAARASVVIRGGFSAESDAGTLSFPGVGFFEDEGSILTPEEQWEWVPAALSPPVGIPTTPVLLRAILEAGGYGVDSERPVLPEYPELVTPPALEERQAVEGAGPLRGILAADPEQFVDGQLTGLTSLLGSRIPSVLMATADCARYGVADDSIVTLTTDFGVSSATVRSCGYQPSGVVAISNTNGETKTLFGWELCGGLPVAMPSRVTIGPAGSAT